MKSKEIKIAITAIVAVVIVYLLTMEQFSGLEYIFAWCPLGVGQIFTHFSDLLYYTDAIQPIAFAAYAHSGLRAVACQLEFE